jgi:hypothetical protein
MCTTSPTCNRLGFSPLEQINPVPIVTVKIWPRSCVCQNVRAPGVKHTLLAMQSEFLNMGSMCTVPVKVSVGCFDGADGMWAARMSCMLKYGRLLEDMFCSTDSNVNTNARGEALTMVGALSLGGWLR